MTDRRRANVKWTVCADGHTGGLSWEGAQLAVLMDIRDALQEANSRHRALYLLLAGDPYRRGHVSMHKLRRHLEALFPAPAKRKRKKAPLAVIRRRKK